MEGGGGNKKKSKRKKKKKNELNKLDSIFQKCVSEGFFKGMSM